MKAEIDRLDGILDSVSSRLNRNLADTGNRSAIDQIDQFLNDTNDKAFVGSTGLVLVEAGDLMWKAGRPLNAGGAFGGSYGGQAMRGSLFSREFASGVKGVGAGLAIVGSAADLNAAVNSFSAGDTWGGIGSSASAASGVFGTIVPPAGLALAVGQLAIKGSVGVANHYIEKEDRNRRAVIDQNDVNTFKGATVRQLEALEKFREAGCK